MGDLLQPAHGVAEAVDVIHKRLEDTDMQSIIDFGMHEFLDAIQLDLIAVAKAIFSLTTSMRSQNYTINTSVTTHAKTSSTLNTYYTNYSPDTNTPAK